MAITVPPANKKEIEEILQDQLKQVYMVICESNCGADDIGCAAEVDLPGVVFIRFQKREDTSPWITDKKMCGAIFGWDEKVVRFLNDAEVQDKDAVYEAINQGRDQ